MQGLYSSNILANLPPQMLPKNQKDKKWIEANMDAFEVIGRNQFYQNMRLVENYEMVKGKFIFNHYFEQPEHADLIDQLTKEFELPSYLRHYDIISQVINTLSGEWQNRPDVFRVKSYDEKTSNEYVRTQTDLLQKYVMGKINAEISAKLLEAGIDENKQDFQSEEEAQQYQQAIAQAKEQMTPIQIQDYMKMNWFTASEMWGQHQLELDRQRFKLVQKEKREFEDMLISDRCFRHFRMTANGYDQETWNPVNTFFHKSPDIEEVENGDYVGRAFYLTLSDIIDRYGHKMNKKQLSWLKEERKKTDKKWNYAAGTDYVYQNYAFPFKDYQTHNILSSTLPQQGGQIPQLDAGFFNSLNTGGKFYGESKGYYLVVEAYWKSQKRIGKVTYQDPETGQILKALVDEDFIVPDDFTEIDSTFSDSEDPNTVVWTWINEVWQGVKICTKGINDHADEDIYLDVSPLEFQFKGDLNPYEAKLPVCGQVFSVRNSQSMSLVDLMKPHQIGYNVAMNQLYQIMQKEVGRFIVMDVNMFPDSKDWGGDKAYEKFMLIAKELGITVADTSAGNTNSSAAAAGGHMPKEINLDETARMVSRLNIAQAFEGFALKQIGFNDYRLGQQASTSSATGVKQGVAQSFAQTESYFTNFSHYVQRCYKMNLDIAQYVQSKQKDVTVMLVKSDMSRGFIKLNGTDLLLSDLHTYVHNSQEELRQLEMLRQLALSNNTTGATMLDLADVITTNSPAHIRAKLEKSMEAQQAQQERAMQMQQQQMEQEAAIAQMKEDREDGRVAATNKSREEVAYINTFARQPDNLRDTNADQTPDVLEFEKLGLARQDAEERQSATRQKNQIDREKFVADKEFKNKKLELDRQKMEADLKIQAQELEYAKIIKKNSDNKK